MSAKSCASLRQNASRRCDVTATLGSNFAGRLVKRLGPNSRLIDAATGVVICPEDLPRLIAACGSSLRSAGLQTGDRVVIACTLSPSTALVYLGVLYAGLVAVPVEDRVVRSSATTLLEATGAKALWSEAGLVVEGVDKGPILTPQGSLTKDLPQVSEPEPRADSDLAALMATSGSTGVPRFVMVNHGNLIANTEAIILGQRLGNEEIAMMILPLSYCFGASLLQSHLYQGGSVVFDRRFMFPDKVLRAIAQHGCTTFAGVPTVYDALLRRSHLRQIAMPSLRRFLQAGGALAPQRISEMRAAFPAASFYVMYGQTEATARISCMEPERWEEKLGSVGRASDKLMVRIVDEDGNDLPAGQVGELLVKGPSICAGYLDDPEETERIFADGWLRTRDLARQDEEGYLWIEGRKGEFLKMRGIRVSFREVETRVSAIPGYMNASPAPSSIQKRGRQSYCSSPPIRG